jgi:hypothetical protein
MNNLKQKALCALAQRLIFVLPLLAGHPLPAQTNDIVLHGTLTRADHEHYRELPFDVPTGTRRITVEFSYTGKEQHTTVDLGIWDNQRFRGWSGGNKNTFTLSETDATPSYLPGSITPGIWKLMLGIPNIREGVTAEYTAKIHLSADDDANVAPFSPVVQEKPRWYRGDLHMHDAHSDGSCQSRSGIKVPCPLFKTLEAAVERGLDFVAVTDHNTVSHFDELRELTPYFDDLLLLHGREITTFQGHANVFGTDRFLDFRVGTASLPDMNVLLQEVQRAHALISINHPAAPSGERCMGCGWTPAPNTDLNLVQAIEAVNGIDSGTPRSGIPFWEQQLNRGYRLTGIGGSDNHNPEAYPPPGPGSIGYPTTVVFARELSEPAILDGIRAGHVFIDVEGTRNRVLEMSAEAGGKTITMGESVQLSSGPLNFTVHAAHAAGGTLEVIEDGKLIADLKKFLPTDNERQSFTLKADGTRHWVRANVRSSEGKLILIGNPIYFIP